MTISEMLGQSLILTLLGMAVVFTFLIILIFCITIMSKIIGKTKAGKEDITTGTSTGASASATQNNAIIAAIAAAVREKQNS
ncbi:MAG: sodium pump decarboxylase subunit gamma [Treponema sp. CETP13]|nr:MAG: sodium pump decarboxylase subunit gamma [Treponema sp. CETP13]